VVGARANSNLSETIIIVVIVAKVKVGVSIMTIELLVVNTQTSFNGFHEASIWILIRGHEQSHDK
jgi:hypothetical protein